MKNTEKSFVGAGSPGPDANKVRGGWVARPSKGDENKGGQTPPLHIRTFGRIHGKKLSARQQDLVENLLPKLSPIPETIGANNYRAPTKSKISAGGFLPLQKPIILEIGFGAGEHLLHLAERHPDAIIIGAEPFINGVASLLSRMTYDVGAGLARPTNTTDSKGGLTPPLQIKPEYRNVRIWPDDVRKLLTLKSQLSTLQNINFIFDKIYILHPDPWPKARHEKRRLLSTEFLNELAGHLAPDGQIIIGTDHTDYFNWVLEQVRNSRLGIRNFKNNMKSTSLEYRVSSHDFTNPPESGLDTRYKIKNKFGSDAPMYMVLGRK